MVRRDDPDADPEGLGGEDLLARELGASMICLLYTSDAADERPGEPAPAAPAAPTAASSAAAREAIQQTRPVGRSTPRSEDMAAADAVVSRDDLDADPEGLGGEDLLARELGASMIEEIKHP